jgi:hypothetical protein
MHRNPAPRQRHRNPAGPDRQLERAPVAGELDQPVDDRVDALWTEHLRVGLVVPRRNGLVEVAVLAAHGAESTVA